MFIYLRYCNLCIVLNYIEQCNTDAFLIALIFHCFLGAGMTVPHWDFLGSTMVTNVYIRLTPEMKSKNGAIWSNVVSIDGLLL